MFGRRERFIQVVFHTKTEVNTERGEQSGQFNVLVFGITAEKLGFEVQIQCVVPFVECLITKVAVDTEHVISDFVIAQSIFGSGLQVVLYFQ